MTLSNELVPRRRWRWRWWIALFVVLLLSWTLFQLFGPNPRIVVSPETTVITSPLRPDGLPDYTKYLRDLGREGVTPENNGAVLFWQAMWPGELERKDWEPLCEALGMQDIPSPDRSLQSPFSKDVEDEVGLWLVRQVQPDFAPQNSQLTTQQLGRMCYRAGAERMIYSAMERPWTSEQIPILAAWLTKHEEQYELLVAASKRPKFWSPSPSALNTVDENTGFMKMPMCWTMRNAIQSLFLRAMWNLGEERTVDAWCDLQACFRLLSLISQGNSVYEELNALHLQALTIHSTITLLHHGNLDIEVARQILREVCEFELLQKVALAVDQETRILYADSAIGLSRGRDKLSDLCGGQVFYYFEPSEYLRFDWNCVLRQGTYWHDKLTTAASRPTRQERLPAFAKYDEEISVLEASFRSDYQAVKGLVSNRDELMTMILLRCVWPVVQEACDVADETETTLGQAQIAAALALYRAEKGEYPISLEALVPDIMKSIPSDPYSETPFRYSRRPDGGYLLYGVYENGVDDGGTSLREEIVKGEWVTTKQYIADDAYDLVIRVPVPGIHLTPDAANMEEIIRY